MSVLKRRFTNLELAVVVVLLLILLAVGGSRVLKMGEDAERAAIYAMLGNLQSQINLRVSQHYIEDRLDELGEVQTENPFLWSDPPPAYGGEVNVTRLLAGEGLEVGRWYFESDQSIILYRARFDRISEGSGAQMGLLRFRILPTYSENSDQQVRGLKVEAVY